MEVQRGTKSQNATWLIVLGNYISPASSKYQNEGEEELCEQANYFLCSLKATF